VSEGAISPKILMKTQVIVLGGGCGGLWLVHELARQHYASVLMDGPNIGGYASTRNQSWLHTGAFYALANQVDIVQQCVRGRDTLLKFCDKWARGAVEDQSRSKARSRCLFLFEELRQAKNFGKRLKDLSLEAEILEGSELKKLEPILSSRASGSAVPRYGVRTLDAPFDSYRIMRGLVNAAFSYGVAFYRSIPGDLSTISVSGGNVGQDWSVSCGTFTAEAPIVVCAAGALNARLLHKSTGSAAGLTVQKCLVAVFHQRLCENILVVRNVDSGQPNLVPFAGGTTVNLGALDRVSLDDDDKLWPEPYADFTRQLTHFLPGIVKYPGCGVHFYVCQKLNNTNDQRNQYPLDDRGARHFFWLETQQNFFHYYPGKFTTAPVAAGELAQKLIARIGSPQKPAAYSDPPSLVQRAYLSPATHCTRVVNGYLTFERLEG
jgi:glycine/D-amino acid oxidase-like deaminating enzyme